MNFYGCQEFDVVRYYFILECMDQYNFHTFYISALDFHPFNNNSGYGCYIIAFINFDKHLLPCNLIYQNVKCFYFCSFCYPILYSIAPTHLSP